MPSLPLFPPLSLHPSFLTQSFKFEVLKPKALSWAKGVRWTGRREVGVVVM